uniref:DDE Tnp4 domain-containing protein n=1 Tax=Anopheles atroparvus TaxID=41427 RepID=A0AAG5DR12_ANOAO
MPDVEFVANFRINKRLFLEIHEKIARTIGPKHTRGLTALHKLAATLKFLAQGSYQRGVGNDFTIPIGQSTFSKVFDQTLRVIQRELKHYVSMDMSEEEKSAARRFFYETSGIPGIVMCVDGTHIKIIAPNEHKEMFSTERVSTA